MTTFLRMQPTCEKKKKFLSVKCNFFLVFGKGEKREKFSQKSSSCGVGGDSGKFKRDSKRKRNGALITPELNHRHYSLKGVGIDICVTALRFEKHFLLLFCGALFLHPLLSSPQNIDQSFCAC